MDAELPPGLHVDVGDAVHLALGAGITTADAMLDLLAEAYPAPMLTPRVQYTAEQVAALVADRLGPDVGL